MPDQEPDVSGTIHEIDSSITRYQHALSMSSRSDPHRALILYKIALEKQHRYTLLNKKEDLDNSISHYTESILLPPLSWLQHGPIILDVLYFLAGSLLVRSKASNQPEDATHAIKYLSHLRAQPHETHVSIPRHHITNLLVDALALKVDLDAGNLMQNIRELAIHCRELLTSEPSDFDATHLIIVIHAAVTSKIRAEVPDQPLDELIECLRAARKRKPDLLEGRIAFAESLSCRYFMTYENDDYEEAASVLDEIINHSLPGDSQDGSVAKARGLALSSAAVLATARSQAYDTPEYLEEAIYRTNASFNSSSVQEHFPFVNLDPEVTAEERFRYFGSIEGVTASSINPLLSQSVSEMSHFDYTVDKMESLGSVIRDNDDTTKINEAIEQGRSILASYPQTELRVVILYSFGNIFFEAFHCTGKIEYLNESISIYRQVIEWPFPSRYPYAITGAATSQLSNTLLARSQFFPGHRTQDLDEALGLRFQLAGNAHTSLPDRCLYACKWAYSARRYRHSSVPTAYETAMSLMENTILFSPTLQLQHATLATHAFTNSLPLDYVSYHVDHHQLEEAIETLERGRALLWSEMRHLRTSIDQLVEADPVLGHRFAAVNRDLEELTKSVPPSHKLTMDDAAADDLKAVDPFGRLLLKQRTLLKDRAELVSHIQALPGFDSFLTSSPFDALRAAASAGPVIIINHSEWRSDILVLRHDMPPSLIPTTDDFFERASALRDKLLESRRKFGLSSKDYDEALAFVLAELYTLVGKPVIDRLHELQVPEQSRIWWCPTSVFCSLPLHAMGPIPSDDDEQRYFLDLYVCSYTPTLSALIQSRNRDRNSRSSDRPSILLVAQPDTSLPTVESEIKTVQALDTKVASLISEAATPATVIDRFRHHRFAHFACHGTLEAGKPFEAGFELHGNKRLTLLEIVRSHLPTAEFAFLAACHTAEATEGSVMDEGLHLAAAVQYCGFRSVVGTMWAMVDEDGQELTENFYKAMFSNSRRNQEIPYHERSAKALRSALKKLRRKRWITLERWVNFVHYGE